MAMILSYAAMLLLYELVHTIIVYKVLLVDHIVQLNP
jgi:hypothetical protein